MTEVLNQAEAMGLLQAMPMAVIVADQENIVWISREAERVAGLDAQALCGGPIDLLPERLRVLFSNAVEQSQLCGEPGAGFRATLKQLNVGRITMVCILTEETEIIQLRGEIKVLETRLGLLDVRDDSSGLLNKRGLQQVIESQVSRSRRYGNPLTLVSMKVNDYGVIADHKAAVLTALGYLFNDRLRWADSVGRLDEDEFIIVLPETDAAAATSLVDKLMTELQTLNLEESGNSVRLVASYGIAAWCQGDDPSRLLSRCQANRQDGLSGKG